MTKVSALCADLKAETDGVWLDYALGVRCRIGRSGTPAYNRSIRQFSAERLKGRRPEDLTEEEFEDITKRAMARHCLLDWENIEDENGDPIPYSEEKALEFLRDPRMHDFTNWVATNMNRMALYRAKQEASDAED